jgi:hypothetical protein
MDLANRTGAIAQKRAGLRRGRTTARFRTAGLDRERERTAPTSPVTATEPTGFREPVHEANGLFLLKARASRWEDASPSMSPSHMYQMWRRVGVYELLRELKRAGAPRLSVKLSGPLDARYAPRGQG